MQKKILFVASVGLSLFIFSLSPVFATEFTNQLASVFFTDSISASDLKEKYDDREKIKILVVPGHDPVKFGTSYDDLTEWELNLELATYLAEELKQNKHFKVGLSQTADGYQPTLETYITKNEKNIWSFVTFKKEIMRSLVATGLVAENVVVDHNFASNDTALKLHGINHYANQNNIDIILHVHFNDYPGRREDTTPKYAGFSIYLPEQQYSNSRASFDIGEYVAEKLGTKFKPSDHPLENTTLIPDQELIAIGSFNTLDAVAILIEYGYIYEPHLGEADAKSRTKTLKKMAELTAGGIEEFFKD